MLSCIFHRAADDRNGAGQLQTHLHGHARTACVSSLLAFITNLASRPYHLQSCLRHKDVQQSQSRAKYQWRLRPVLQPATTGIKEVESETTTCLKLSARTRKGPKDDSSSSCLRPCCHGISSCCLHACEHLFTIRNHSLGFRF